MPANITPANKLSSFWSYVSKTPGCWKWVGYVHHASGYGGYSQMKAHRRAWELTNGPIPNGMHVLHKCNNKLCVNPQHLYLGDASDNAKDTWRDNKRSLKTHCKRGHKLRRMAPTSRRPQGQAYCPACWRILHPRGQK